MSGECTQGILKMKKTSTKVIAPPGGKTQLNLFSQAEVEDVHQINVCQASRNKSSVFGGDDSVPTKPVQLPDQEATAKPAQKPSTKVMAPPGGASSFSFGGGPQPAAPRPPAGARSCTSNVFGGSDEKIGQRAANRRPPGGESHNIFG